MICDGRPVPWTQIEILSWSGACLEKIHISKYILLQRLFCIQKSIFGCISLSVSSRSSSFTFFKFRMNNCCKNFLPCAFHKFFTLFICRIICTFYCITMASLHQVLGSSKESSAALNIYLPSETAYTFFLLSLLHISGTVAMFQLPGMYKRIFLFFWRLVPRALKSSGKKGNGAKILELYSKYIGPNGIYGRRGTRYEYRLVLREMIEIPSQSWQAYQMSQRVPNLIFPNLYGVTIVLDCLLVPVILKLEKVGTMEKRNLVMLLDIFVDTFLGAIIPLFVMFPPLLQFFANPAIRSDLVWSSTVFTTVKYLLVSDAADLLTSIIPLFFGHSLMNMIHQSWYDVEAGNTDLVTPSTGIVVGDSTGVKRKKVSKSPKKFGGMFEKVFGAASTLWGFGLIFLMIRALGDTSCTSNSMRSEACLLPLKPWIVSDSNECQCLFVYLNCKYNDNLSSNLGTKALDQINATLSSDFSDSALSLVTDDCPISAVPDVYNKFTKLLLFNFARNQFINLDNIRFELMPNLFAVRIASNTMLSHVPSGLKDAPLSLYYLEITGASITEIPSWLCESLNSTALSFLSINYNQVTELPSELYELENLVSLDAAGNNITGISSSISKLVNLQKLFLQGNQLSSIPDEIKSLKSLSNINIAQNLLQSVPWTAEDLKSLTLNDKANDYLTSMIIKFDYNPVCDTAEYQSLEACMPNCSPQCDISWLENIECEEACNTAECDWDNGSCSIEKQLRYVKNL